MIKKNENSVIFQNFRSPTQIEFCEARRHHVLDQQAPYHLKHLSERVFVCWSKTWSLLGEIPAVSCCGVIRSLPTDCANGRPVWITGVCSGRTFWKVRRPHVLDQHVPYHLKHLSECVFVCWSKTWSLLGEISAVSRCRGLPTDRDNESTLNSPDNGQTGGPKSSFGRHHVLDQHVPYHLTHLSEHVFICWSKTWSLLGEISAVSRCRRIVIMCQLSTHQIMAKRADPNRVLRGKEAPCFGPTRPVPS